MSKNRLEWKVGLFVVIGLVLLGVLMLQFSKGVTFFRSTYNILLHSADVSGLRVKANVLMSGVQVGTVSAISLTPDGKSVTITLKIYSNFVIHKDARFLIETAGFLGDQYVSIVPTENKKAVFQNNEPANAEPPFNLQEVARSATGFVQRIDETAKKLNDSLIQVQRLLLNEATLTNLSEAAVNMRAASESARVAIDAINDVVRTNSAGLGHSSSNLVVFSDQMKTFATALNQLVETNSTGVHATLKNVETSSEVLKSLMQDVQAGKGLAGNLLQNDELASRFSLIGSNLSVTTSNLNRLGLWGVLWKHKPPATNAPTVRPLTTPKDRR